MKTLIYIISLLFCINIAFAEGNYWDNSKVGREYMVYTCVLLPPIEIISGSDNAFIRIIKGTQLYPDDLYVTFGVSGLPYGSEWGYQFAYNPVLPYGDGSGLTVDGVWEMLDNNHTPSPDWVPITPIYQHGEFSDGGDPPLATGIDIRFRVTNVDAQTNPGSIALGMHDIPITLTVTYVEM